MAWTDSAAGQRDGGGVAMKNASMDSSLCLLACFSFTFVVVSRADQLPLPSSLPLPYHILIFSFSKSISQPSLASRSTTPLHSVSQAFPVLIFFCAAGVGSWRQLLGPAGAKLNDSVKHFVELCDVRVGSGVGMDRGLGRSANEWVCVLGFDVGIGCASLGLLCVCVCVFCGYWCLLC